MPRTLLSRHTRIATTDLDRARAEVAAAFCPHDLAVVSRDGALDVVHNAAPIGNAALNYLRYGDEVRITPGAFESFYLLQIPLSGRARVTVGDRVVYSDRHRASLPSPTDSVDMVWSADCEQLIVYLPREDVEAQASSQGPGEDSAPVVFDPSVDLGTAQMRSWLRLLYLAVDELDLDAGVFTSPLAASHFEQVLISGLLTAQPNDSMLGARSEGGAVMSRATRTACDLIEASPEHPWSVAELAQHAGVSTRTLQEAFHRDRGSSPLEELRRVRMARARADLVAAAPQETNVTAIASRWGFFHLGRFAQNYSARYAELPSHTLGRAAR